MINSFICVSKFRLVNTKHISIFESNQGVLYTGLSRLSAGDCGLTCGVRAALVVPQGAQAAGARRERRAPGGGPKRRPDGIVLKATGLAAGAEVRIG